LVAVYDLSQPTMSHHMGVLRRAGLVDWEKRGLWSFYSLRQDLPPATKRLVESLT
jgi:ArsR family transcriptional regulator